MIKFFHPVSLFGIAACLANLPYLLWALNYPRPSAYDFTVSYIPLFLWATAFLSFAIGAALTHRIAAPRTARLTSDWQLVRPKRLFAFTLIVASIIIVQLFEAYRLYGAVPLLSFVGGLDIETVNVAEEASSFGQLGLLILSLSLAGSVFYINLISSNRLSYLGKLLLVMYLLLILGGVLFQGKRQGLAIFLFGLMYVSTVHKNHVFNSLVVRFGFRPFSLFKSILVLIALLFVFLFLFGFIAYVRVGGLAEMSPFSGIEEVIHYLSLPLINTEAQIAASGWFIGDADLAGPLTGLLPYKYAATIGAFEVLTPRLELSVGSGMVGTIHWYWGLPGVIFYCFLVGIIAMYLYTRAPKRLFALLAYAQISWTLFAAHTYNHFLALVFVPLPIVAIYVATRILQARPRSKVRLAPCIPLIKS